MATFQVPLQIGDLAGRRFEEVEATVQKFAALERRRLGDSVEGGERLVELQLIGVDLSRAQGAAVGAFGHQTTNIIEQRAYLTEGGVSGGNHLIGALSIADRLLDGGDVAPQVFTGDQTGRVVLTGVDAKTGAEPRERLLQGVIGPGQRIARDQ